MIVKGIKTDKVRAGEITIFELLNKFLLDIAEGSVVAVTSKVISICEGRIVPSEGVEKQDLIEQEADFFLPASISKYSFRFTITDNTLIPAAGIDESNSDGNFVLWPKNSQQSANQIREYLVKRFGLKKVGVIITDSTAAPLRYGTQGIVLAHSGFLATNDYRGTPDLFGRTLKVSISSIAGALAVTAVMIMGEGTEQTPIVVIEDVDFVEFQPRNPTQEELDKFYIPIIKDDLFAPFLERLDWQPGKRKAKQ